MSPSHTSILRPGKLGRALRTSAAVIPTLGMVIGLAITAPASAQERGRRDGSGQRSEPRTRDQGTPAPRSNDAPPRAERQQPQRQEIQRAEQPQRQEQQRQDVQRQDNSAQQPRVYGREYIRQQRENAGQNQNQQRQTPPQNNTPPVNNRPDRGSDYNGGRPDRGNDRPDNRQDNRNDRRDDRRDDRYDNRNDRRDDRYDNRRDNNDWNDRRRRSYYNDRDFYGYNGPRIGFYFAPNYGYYRVPDTYYNYRYGRGDYLPRYFFSYRVANYNYYDLPYPPAGCAYFYVGNDIVLVRLSTGLIIDIFYDIF